MCGTRYLYRVTLLYMRALIFWLCLSLIAWSCTADKTTSSAEQSSVRIPIRYARGFVIEQYADHYKVIVRDPLDTTMIIDQYILIKGTQQSYQGQPAIQIPVKRMVSLSTTHVGFLRALDKQQALVGFSGTKYICDSLVRALVASGHIQEVGNEGGLDHERILALKPDMVMTYQTGNAAYDQIEKLRTLQLSPVINNEFRELSPLGQAEWIKFIAVFFDALPEAEAVFAKVEKEYLSLKHITEQVPYRPSVFTGMAFKGEWTIPGGKSFAAQYFRDAGAAYLWSDDARTGNFQVTLSEVIERAAHARYWLHPGDASDLAGMQKSDSRYTFFDAWKNAQVYNNNAQVHPAGGNAYWESGIVYPNIILKDLVFIFHPELLPGHRLQYYTLLP